VSYLIDTDWVNDYLNGDRKAIDLLDGLSRDHLAISLITYGEVYDGIYSGRNPTASEAGFVRLLDVVHVIHLDEEIMRRFARIRGTLRRQGQKIGDSDIMIAATAIHHGLTLVTRNVTDFRRVPGLKLYQPA